MPPPEPQNRPGAWCLFRSDGQPLAVSLASVYEVFLADRLTRLPLAPPRVVGLCSSRRDIIPVLRDPDHVTEPPHVAADSHVKALVLVLRSEMGRWGLRLDSQDVVVLDATAEVYPHGKYGPAAIVHDGVEFTVIDADENWKEIQDSMREWFAPRQHGGGQGPATKSA